VAAIEGAIEVRVPALGDAATHLPWLSPCAASLLALARPRAVESWDEVRNDPGAVLLLARQSVRNPASCQRPLVSTNLQDPAVLDVAIRYLAGDSGPGARPHGLPPVSEVGSAGSGFVDWTRSSIQPIYHTCLTYARIASGLAASSGRCDKESAWVAGLLAPLGWLAVCAIEPDQAAACLGDPALSQNPIAVQQHHWGNDQAAIARRLIWRWRLPRWLGVVIGHLGLPLEIAQGLGADVDLFRIVQLAVGMVQQQGLGLHLIVGADPSEHCSALGITSLDRDGLLHELTAPVELPWPKSGWKSPHSIPLLSDLLLLAAENQRLHSVPAIEQLERDQDFLHQALEEQRTGETQRLRELKLEALAEFAGGAAHEINNPLAVISGQAQYLLGRDEDPSRQRALQTIIGQSQRIHQVLNELMQFARPPKPRRQVVDVRILLREVILALSDLAGQKHIQLRCTDPDQSIHLHVDPEQVRTVLQCLLRNAIEAAPSGGWASLSIETHAKDSLDFIIEDNGVGPTPAQRDHLFDPFYSGRQAGRGRGLGLPTAWRLARENGGAVRFDGLSDGPTRFILSLSREADIDARLAAVAHPEINEPDSRPEPANGRHLPILSNS